MQSCPHCHALNALDAIQCANCGAALSYGAPIAFAEPQQPTPASEAPQSGGTQPTAPASCPGAPVAGAAPLSPEAPAGMPPAYPPAYPGYPPTYPSYPTGPSAAPYQAPPSMPYQGAPSMPYQGAPSMPYQGAPSMPYQGAPSMPYQAPPMPYQAPPTVPLGPVTGAMGAPINTSQTLEGMFGPDIEPTMAQPSTRLQQSLMRNVSSRYAVNRWFMAGFGAIIATVIGLLLTFVTQSFVANAISNAIDAASGSSSAAPFINGITKSVITPDVLKAFALEHRIPFVLTLGGSAGGTSLSGDITFTMPFTGLILIPALSLLIGGYVSAASDFQRTGKFSMARGALVGPFYAVIVAALAYFSTSSAHMSILGADLSASVSPVIWQAFLYGLLWGVVFGGLGGWIQFTGRGFLSLAIPIARARYGQTLAGARVVGALAGSLVATFAGIAATSALLVSFMGFGLVYLALFPSASSVSPQLGSIAGGSTSPTGGNGSIVELVIFVALALAPTFAIYVFTLATGTTINSASVNSIGATGSTNSAIGLFTGQHPLSATVLHWSYALALIPALCYFAGGRIAARTAGAQTSGDGFIAGSLMAIPASIMLALLAYLAGMSIEVAIVGQSLRQSVSPNVGGMFLTTLIAGTVLGGLGGLTATSRANFGSALRLLILPFWPLSGWLSARLDHFTGNPQDAGRSLARTRLYDAALAVLGLGALAIILDICNVTIAAMAPFKTLITVDAAVAALLLFIPVILLISAVAAEFGSPTMLAAHPAMPGAMLLPAANQYGPFPGTFPQAPYGHTGPAGLMPGSYMSPASTPAASPNAAWSSSEPPTREQSLGDTPPVYMPQTTSTTPRVDPNPGASSLESSISDTSPRLPLPDEPTSPTE